VLERDDYTRILKEFHRRTIFASFQQKIDFLRDWKLFNAFSRMLSSKRHVYVCVRARVRVYMCVRACVRVCMCARVRELA